MKNQSAGFIPAFLKGLLAVFAVCAFGLIPAFGFVTGDGGGSNTVTNTLVISPTTSAASNLALGAINVNVTKDVILAATPTPAVSSDNNIITTGTNLTNDNTGANITTGANVVTIAGVTLGNDIGTSLVNTTLGTAAAVINNTTTGVGTASSPNGILVANSFNAASGEGKAPSFAGDVGMLGQIIVG